MAQIIWAESALTELDDIAEYISLSNPNAARELVVSIFEAVQRLSIFPESGRIPTELENFPYREVVANPCRVFYKLENDKIYVLHVMRQERDLQNFMLGKS